MIAEGSRRVLGGRDVPDGMFQLTNYSLVVATESLQNVRRHEVTPTSVSAFSVYV